MRRLLFLILLSALGAWLVRSYLFEAISVASGSMEPTLTVGLHFGVNKFVYRVHPPRHGDIVVFINPIDPDKGMIKRVIAIGGDKVELREKKVFLNGSPIEEPYVQYKRAHERLEGDTLGPLTVPEGTVFVLGDNRDVSEDSTVWKDPKTGEHVYFVPTGLIKGKLIQLP